MRNLADRHQYIIQKIQENGQVSVVELCNELDVSAVTIRKDLKLLEDKQLLYRTHGGASLHNPYIRDKPVNEKEVIQAAEKDLIGKAAAAMIRPNDSIIIASGTTVLALARNIVPQGNLTVITPSLPVAMELSSHPDIDILQLGGQLRHSSFSVTGPFAEKLLSEISCSKLFIGVDGIDPEYGLTTTNLMEARLNQQMLKSAQVTVVLADSSKFGKRSFGKICNLHEIERIITDAGISKHMVKALEDAGVTVTIV